MLTAKANELRTLKANHDDNMAKMRTLITSLNDIWKGEAQTAFVNKYESMQTTFNSFSEMLEGYAKLMDNSAQKMQETDTSIASSISSFG
jgi:WXG100 family type VII secretion target